MFGKRCAREEGLVTRRTLDCLATVGLRSLVTTEVGKLRVALQAHLALERLDTAAKVNMSRSQDKILKF